MSPSDLRERHRLAPEHLRWVCDPAGFSFDTTAELHADEVIVGQDRAVQALDLGLSMTQPGYHVFISGPVGTGRTTYAKKKVQAASAARPTSPDWCYVYNFQQPDQPIAVSLPPGTGAQFRKDMDELVTELQDLIRKLFSSERFEERKAELLAEF
ncbi:MAG TPA: Lon-like protease helical domain-containing protein, partial [bacterium]|nr:Lon-like protease helical domain-containing protein [bacterium]